ncbi:MAG TPA: hypothetical protein VMT52_01605 [Planctomycetota bacterium]|nr:hypothetical protein [Planctomycetota bacterium]
MLRKSIFITVLLAITPLEAENWPQFRGPTGLGYTSESSLPSTWASPIADPSGRIFFASAGKSVVIEAGPGLKVLATNDLGDPNHASPAVAGGRMFLVGTKAVYCVGKK